jgi:predicted metalloprotease
MRWTGRRSTNIEDRRGGGRGVPVAVGGGLGTIVIILAALFFGIDPSVILQSDPSAPVTEAPGPSSPGQTQPGQDEVRDFVSVVLADTEDTWAELFRRMNREYQDPRLVLFTGSVQSACGIAGAAVGPFYCPGDHKLYLDLSFFRELRSRFGAPGDFAQAYVIAHEVGHHVQTLLGISEQVARSRQRADRATANALSVRQELQADCFSGVWAHHAQRTRQILEEGDLEEALGAAAAIGDDRLQRQAQGHVAPESFTHGSSAQRVRWFKRGFDSGAVRDCDTFRTERL